MPRNGHSHADTLHYGRQQPYQLRDVRAQWWDCPHVEDPWRTDAPEAVAIDTEDETAYATPPGEELAFLMHDTVKGRANRNPKRLARGFDPNEPDRTALRERLLAERLRARRAQLLAEWGGECPPDCIQTNKSRAK